jgi:cytochrome b561
MPSDLTLRGTSARRYDSVAMTLHWLIALIMIPMLFFGEDLIRRQPDTFLPSIHVSAGITILLLSLARLGWRLMNPPPPLPLGTAAWEATVSKISHSLFYVLMIGLPLTGLLAIPHFVSQHPAMAGIQIFGLFTVPQIEIPSSIRWGGLHSLGGNIGIALLVLHVAAALKHQFWNGNGVLIRMLPHR